MPNKIYKKTASNTWVHVGSQAWHNSLPVFTVASGTTVTNSATMVINGTTVTTGGTALSNVATAINTSSDGGDGVALAGISASVVTYALAIDPNVVGKVIALKA